MALFLNDVAFRFIKKLQITKLNLHIRKKLDPSNSNLYPNPVPKKKKKLHLQFVQGLLALHPWWVDVRFEFAHKKWQCQFTRFLISWAALDNYKKIRKRLFIKQSLKQQKSKNLFPNSHIPKTQILNSLFPPTFPATKQKKKFPKISRTP